MITHSSLPQQQFHAKAVLLGERIDLRGYSAGNILAMNPLTVSLGEHQLAVLYRYGAVVMFGVGESGQSQFIETLGHLVGGKYERPEMEEVEIKVGLEIHEGVQGSIVHLDSVTVERLQVIADVLSKSVVLAMYESRVAANFDKIEPLARNLEKNGRIAGDAKQLLKHIGTMLLSEQMMVGRVEMTEKPEALWNHPELEGLFVRMEGEFEIRERHAALERKLNLIARTVQTLLELLHSRHSLRLEWYVVILIVAEILLTLYTIF